MKRNFIIFTLLLYINILAKGGNCVVLKAFKNKPFIMNVTYQNPLDDLNERKKYAQEEIAYKRRVREIEQKIEADSDLLKMILNINNIQIQKLSEVVNVNLATLYYKALHFLPQKRINLRPKIQLPLVDVNSASSMERFINIMIRLGLVSKDAAKMKPSVMMEAMKQGKLPNPWEEGYDSGLMKWVKKQDISNNSK